MSRKSRGQPPNVLDPALQEARLIEKMSQCRETKFYGTVTLFIQAGNLVRFETRHVEKLEPEPEGRDGLSSKEAQAAGQQDQEASAHAQQAGEAG